MTELAQTALAFAREVMGWERPTDRKYGERERDPFGKPSKAWTPYIFDFYGKHPQFHYTDLNAVMDAVRGWCGSRGLGWCLNDVGQGVEADVSPIDEPYGFAAAKDADPCQALMAACVEAARKLKAA